ncbi:MAG: hypothetical protein D6729_09745, partial [Deltaproteobacteria bacterium]
MDETHDRVEDHETTEPPRRAGPPRQNAAPTDPLPGGATTDDTAPEDGLLHRGAASGGSVALRAPVYVPADYAEKAMNSLMALHQDLMAEKERIVELKGRLLEERQARVELEAYVALLEAELRRRGGPDLRARRTQAPAGPEAAREALLVALGTPQASASSRPGATSAEAAPDPTSAAGAPAAPAVAKQPRAATAPPPRRTAPAAGKGVAPGGPAGAAIQG